ncbi:DUF1206 domain-containing protein [Tessaracoccus flavus]|nr:DUF1206 domain-containing protein [Tessaracoccus flavus]SDY84268.1 protein of unknown function [Tessaracoccus flavus]
MSDAMGKVEDAAKDVEDHPAASWVAAAGHVANGIVHAVIGLIAISIARGAAGEADQGGAMRAIESTPLGEISLWVVGVSMVGLGLYTLATAIGQLRDDLWQGLKDLGRMVTYFAVGVVALTYATGGTSSGEGTTESLSARLMATGWGSILLVIVGLAIVAIGVGMIVSGVRQRFMRHVDVSPKSQKWFVPLGIAGYVAKGLAVAAVGVLFVVAVWTSDPSQTGGLDGALKSFTQLPFGRVVLFGIAVGLITYGLFCLARARKAKPA